MTAILFALAIPPLVRAYLAIQNRLRVLWFGFYFVLFPYLLWGPFFGGLEYLMVYRGVLDEPVIGIGLLFIVNEVVTIVGFALTQRYLDTESEGKGGGRSRLEDDARVQTTY